MMSKPRSSSTAELVVVAGLTSTLIDDDERKLCTLERSICEQTKTTTTPVVDAICSIGFKSKGVETQGEGNNTI